jgi:hypothetical protein
VRTFVVYCTFDYTATLCGVHACYGKIEIFVIIELIGFSGLSSCLIAIFNMALLIRFIRQKYRIHGLVQWKKQRKLAGQMITLSLLFLVFNFPLAIIYLVRLFGPPDWASQVLSIFFFLSYFSILLFPYVCLGNIPDLWKKLNKCNARQRQVAIA